MHRSKIELVFLARINKLNFTSFGCEFGRKHSHF